MFACKMTRLPHCCGFYEAGEFRETTEKISTHYILRETPEDLVKACLDFADGRPVIFNFVKCAKFDEWDEEPTGEFDDNYECHLLRNYIKQYKNVIDLGKHINPGTHNRIHSLVIKDY